MPKVTLDQTYLYKGKYYGPGEADFPELEDADKSGLAPGLKDALEGKTVKPDVTIASDTKSKETRKVATADKP